MVKLAQGTEIFKQYKKLKFKNTIYQLDNDIVLANEDNQLDFVGKLLDIIRIET